jgi:hypothetical protein
MDSTKVDSQVIDAINQIQTATMSPQVILTSGAGKAYQAVAQATAIAVQDATDTLRNFSTLTTTAVGVAMAQFLATGDPKYAAAITIAQGAMSEAVTDFANIGRTSAEVLKGFPSG